MIPRYADFNSATEYTQVKKRALRVKAENESYSHIKFQLISNRNNHRWVCHTRQSFPGWQCLERPDQWSWLSLAKTEHITDTQFHLPCKIIFVRERASYKGGSTVHYNKSYIRSMINCGIPMLYYTIQLHAKYR